MTVNQVAIIKLFVIVSLWVNCFLEANPIAKAIYLAIGIWLTFSSRTVRGK